MTIGAATPSSVRNRQPSVVLSPRYGQESPVRIVVLALLCLVTMSGLLAARKPLAQAAPVTGWLYEMAGFPIDDPVLKLKDVKTVLIQDGTTPVLTVVGTIANPNREKRSVPKIRITVRDEAAETLYTWTASAPKASLGPGESVVFTSRLEKPPGQGRDLAVSFADDRVALSEAAMKGLR